MTAFVRSWLVMASVALFSLEGWAQDAQFEGFAPGWGVQYNAGHQPASLAPDPAYELLPENRAPWYNFDAQYELELLDVVAGSWVKVEYLHADFQRPGNSILGARMAQVEDPREPFLVTAGDVLDARAIVPDTSRLDLNAQSGVRTTVGIGAFRDFSLVASYVGLEDMNSSFRITPGSVDPSQFPEVFDLTVFPDSVRFFATSVLDDGSPGSRVILYDRLFEVDYTAKYWSGDINMLWDYHTPDTGFRFQPMLGFRYNSYDENLIQHGEFDNSSGVDALLGTLTTPERNTIHSATQNTFYMAQLGFQAELVDKWFTLGVAPKVAMGPNVIQSNVLTADLRDSSITELANDGITTARKNNVIVGTNIDLNAYLTIRVNPWLSLTGSGFYWYMPNVARAHDTLLYDDLGIDTPPAMRPIYKTRSMAIHGFTVGAEVTF